jgi:CRISPR-associated protein Cmr4
VEVTEFLMYLYAESPVHTGAADSLDVLDLPVQREAATGYPVIWGQSLKGALRQAAREHPGWGQDQVTRVFGSEVGERGENGGTVPGLLAVGDAQLVAMPIPTLRRTFAWVTSEIALGRLARKYSALGRDSQAPAVPHVADDEGHAATGWREAGADGAWADYSPAAGEVLGPYVIPLGPDAGVTAWAARVADDAFQEGDAFRPFGEKLRTDLVLAGADLAPHLFRECTEQAVRVQLSTDQKTVENGPFYSEYLSTETILAASLTLRKPRGDGADEEHQAQCHALGKLLDGSLLRIGGDETLGKGLVWSRLLTGRESR